jgi:methylated-DNA-protein-cysteine methyltransferase related protein
MPRTDEAAMWYAVVYKAIQQIPHGRVTSYGHIARLVGFRKSTQRDLFGDEDDLC